MYIIKLNNKSRLVSLKKYVKNKHFKISFIIKTLLIMQLTQKTLYTIKKENKTDTKKVSVVYGITIV